MTTKSKVITISSVAIILFIVAFCFFRYCFVFGEGVKAGELNFIVYKGYIFKTYEGKLIQSGFNSKTSSATIQSNEFQFSIVDEKIADSLMRCSGCKVELHYKEYLHALPWRGMSTYIVDDILSVDNHRK